MGTTQRPTPITVICVLGFIGAALGIFGLLALAAVSGTGALKGVAMPVFPSWYVPVLGISVVVGFAALVGLWMMKKWGAFLYIGNFIFGVIVQLVGGQFSPISLIIPAIIIAYIVKYLPEME